MSISEKKVKSKPWLTQGILVSIKKKNIIYRKYIKEKNEQIKLDLHEEFKYYRNTINRLLRLNKSEH